MSKKKMIGLIIGVLVFALLVFGTTYAFLAQTLTVTNANYNINTTNFYVNYSNNNGSIGEIPRLAVGTPDHAASISITYKYTGTVNGTLTLYLNTDMETVNGVPNTSQALLDLGAINYAVCVGRCTSFNSSNVTTGHITADTPLKYELLSDTPSSASSTKNIYVYFWLDASLISEGLNTKYTGYISAEAVQRG